MTKEEIEELRRKFLIWRQLTVYNEYRHLMELRLSPRYYHYFGKLFDNPNLTWEEYLDSLNPNQRKIFEEE